ncbi:MAG: GlxA family transcriptional regulator [Alphaproteobacteria bacterium]|nr:GlxA family transcriptional regulator [Alphaproteobacteria bacterium]
MAERTMTRRIPPKRVVLVLLPGVQLLGVIGPLEVFDAANRILAHRGRPPAYELVVAGLGPQTASVTGLAATTVPLAEIDALHTLLVGGTWDLAREVPDAGALGVMARLAARAERVVSICQGAFVLGELGLLDGRRCTTHWLSTDLLRRRFPAARVEPDAIYTEDGKVLTSAGVTAGIDLALHIVRSDCGARLSLAVAQAMVVFVHRPGGQSQFSTALRLKPGVEERFRRLITEVMADPAGDHRVDDLAARVGMSPRNFARVFRKQTGETPAAFVGRVRVEAAQRALLSGDAPIAQVADDCGFGTEETFRRTFQRVMGVAPGDYRRRFGAAPATL